jgi:hypothetical protein
MKQIDEIFNDGDGSIKQQTQCDGTKLFWKCDLMTMESLSCIHNTMKQKSNDNGA